MNRANTNKIPQLNIPRIGDLPYYVSPPMQFSLTQTAVLDLGTYKFLDAAGGNPLQKTVMDNTKNITDNSLIYIYSISFSADIPVLDYQQALQLSGGTVDIPTFQTFLESDADSPQFKDPILLKNYFEDQSYRLVLNPKQDPNQIKGLFSGQLQQTFALAGISEINFTFDMYAQEIVDDNFIAAFKQQYPDITNGGVTL